MSCWKAFVVFFGIAILICGAHSQSEKEWLCGACRIINHEIVNTINAADDTKTTRVGSFRVDPNGNQKTVERKFKRSQIHIHEVMEALCGQMSNYGRLISAPAGKTDKVRIYQFVSHKTADGQTSDFVDKSQEVRNKLQHKCDDILDEHEEWLETYFAKEVTAADADRELCLMRAGYCKIEELAHSLIPPPIPSPKKEETPPEESDEDSEKSEL